jgi:hypothetical protein
MARVTSLQRSNIKRIIEECFKPDTTFRDNEGGQSNPAFSQMPVESFIADIHNYMKELGKRNNYQYVKELYWLKTHYEIGTPFVTIAEWFGYTTGEPIERRVDDFEDEAVYSMDEWLADKCLAIYEEFFTGPRPIVRRAPRVAAGAKSLLDKVFQKC